MIRICIICLLAVTALAAATAQSVVVSAAEEFDEYRRLGIAIDVRDLEVGHRIELFVGDAEVPHTEMLVIEAASQEAQAQWQPYQVCMTDEDVRLNEGKDAVMLLPVGVQRVRCALSGIPVGAEVPVYARLVDSEGIIFARSARYIGRTDVTGTRPNVPESRTTIYALIAVVLSILILLFGLRAAHVSRHGRMSGTAYVYVAPAVLGLFLVSLFPVVYGFGLAFTDAHQHRLGDAQFVGLEQFINLGTAPGLLRVGAFTAVWTIANTILGVGLGLAIAVVLNGSLQKWTGIYRSLLLLPWAVPAYITTLAWRGMLQPDGFINGLLGTDAVFLSDAAPAQLSVILVSVWLGVPFIVMSMAGPLQSIPDYLYQAAKIDGVSRWRRFIHITLPNIKGVLAPITLLTFVWSFNMFNTIYLLTAGGPSVSVSEPGATDILVTYIFEIAIDRGDYGLASAWSLILFLVLAVVSLVFIRQTRATEGIS